VYQIGPRMADHWAAAGMSAGHPNTASPLNLRNIGFAIHVGAQDTQFDRNKKGAEWGQMLESLAAAEPGAYANQWEVHEGRGHWMELEDAVSIGFMQGFTRNPVPPKVVWRQAELTRTRMYWLAVDEGDAVPGATVRANYSGNTVALTEVSDVPRLRIRLSDAMVDLDKPVRVENAGRELFAQTAARTIDVLARTLAERGDPSAMFSAEVALELR
jgi:hypothetical protein